MSQDNSILRYCTHGDCDRELPMKEMTAVGDPNDFPDWYCSECYAKLTTFHYHARSCGGSLTFVFKDYDRSTADDRVKRALDNIRDEFSFEGITMPRFADFECIEQ